MCPGIVVIVVRLGYFWLALKSSATARIICSVVQCFVAILLFVYANGSYITKPHTHAGTLARFFARAHAHTHERTHARTHTYHQAAASYTAWVTAYGWMRLFTSHALFSHRFYLVPLCWPSYIPYFCVVFH